MSLADKQQREEAINHNNSYIVQAPAGSGKTEILTQRFLNLLARVNSPEQVVALTFTKKAANEMRERVFLALKNADLEISPTSEHQQITYNYAKAALKNSRIKEWNLINQPARLRIITLDSLCQSITNAIPLQENQIAYAKISDMPEKEYLQAAMDCINFAASNANYQTALKNLLEHIDNRQDKLLTLFCELLAKRDQWLALLYKARSQDKSSFEDAIKSIEQNELTRFKKSIPLELTSELINIVKLLASTININNELKNWSSFDQLNTNIANNLTSILLTSQNNLRKSFDHHVGLKKGLCKDEDYSYIKNQSKELLAKLNELPDFISALIRIKNLPDPKYNNYQWEVLQSLFTLLPILAAHLNLIFNKNNVVDFTAISSEALHALGSDENPTDLTLYLDNKIQHILVDEFQDTSLQQYHLLTKLVQGWELNDGRSLFLVGDPMQSIYRFRAAEVGLFLKVREFGLGNIKLNPLELTCNFRSSSTIVDWVNLHFKNIFPINDDIRSGAISYAKSFATKGNTDNCYVRAYQFEDANLEAQTLVQVIIKELQDNPEDNIAILVKSRRQLREIMRLIREQGIVFQGVDIDLLANLPHLRDIYSLTEALLMPANRLAWLSLLRSPLIGMSLSDLYLIANFKKTDSIYFALENLSEINGLSNNGYIRGKFIYSILDNALKNRYQYSIVDWVLLTLNNLQVDFVLTDKEQEDLEQYWELLEKFEKDGVISDWQLLKEEFNSLYSKKATTSRLQIMTIHKSKGLEFDTVIIPSIGSKSTNQDQPLLRWLTLPSDSNEDACLVSPIKASHDEVCNLYNYLGKIDNEKNFYELQRLFYVAVTRAKKRLYISDNQEKIRSGSFRSLLKDQVFIKPEEHLDFIHEETSSAKLKHLPIDYYKKECLIENSYISKNNNYNLTTSTPRLIGIVAHELLQWICNNHPKEITAIPWQLAENRLISNGFHTESLLFAMEQLKKQINNLYNTPIGKWLIKEHSQEQNEYEVIIKIEDKIETRIIDRTFYDKDSRWIIDFKTGKDDKSMENKYRKQLNAYAELFAKKDKQIQCGLYYLENNHWLEWSYLETVELI